MYPRLNGPRSPCENDGRASWDKRLPGSGLSASEVRQQLLGFGGWRLAVLVSGSLSGFCRGWLALTIGSLWTARAQRSIDLWAWAWSGARHDFCIVAACIVITVAQAEPIGVRPCDLRTAPRFNESIMV